MSERPVCSLDAEKAVLGAMLQFPPAALQGIELLRREEFYSEIHQMIFGVMEALAEAGQVVDLVTVADTMRRSGLLDRIKDGSHYIGYELPNTVATAAQLPEHTRIIKECAWARTLRNQFTLGIQTIDRRPSNENLKETLERVQDLALTLSQQNREITQGTPLCDLYLEALGREVKRNERGITTGFPGLDRMTSGIEPGEMWLVCARPSLGKTAFSLSMLYHIAKKHKVLYVSLEQTEEAIGWRLLGIGSGVETKLLREGVLSTREREALTDAYVRMDRWKWSLRTPPSLTVGQLRRMMQSERNEGTVDLVMIDYLGTDGAFGEREPLRENDSDQPRREVRR
jgi:replicative DNA helicase